MKIILILSATLLLLALSGCTSQEEESAYSNAEPIDISDMYVITNRFFRQQVMGILNEPDRHIGRVVQFRGVFVSQIWAETGDEFFYVAQFDDDCCGTGMSETLGFEVYLNNLPRINDFTWVEVTGLLENYYAEGYGAILRVNAISIEVLDDPELWS